MPGTRWIRPELLHLTLVFLGQTDAARVATLSAALANVAHRHAPYETRVDGAGGHIGHRPDACGGGVAWLTLSAGFRETAETAADADISLDSGSYDARRRPRPHLTVARSIPARGLVALRDLAAPLDLSWLTSRIVLYRSVLGPRGSDYEQLSIHELGAEKLTLPRRNA